MSLDRAARSQRASAVVDLVCVFVIMVPLALLAVNIGYLCLGSFVNDSACREAARAASQEPNLGNAQASAAAVVKTFTFAGGALGSPQVTGVNYNFATDEDGNPINVTDLAAGGMAKAPSVQVVTQLIAKTPAPMLITGNGLASQVVLTSTYSFPVMTAIDPNPNADENDSADGDNGEITPPDSEAQPDSVDNRDNPIIPQPASDDSGTSQGITSTNDRSSAN